ncbi:DNA polymerase [Cytobacillus sp. Hm23]
MKGSVKLHTNIDMKLKPTLSLCKNERQNLQIANHIVLPDNYFIVWTMENMEEMISCLKGETAVAVQTETMGSNVFKDDIVSISFYAHKSARGYYLPLKHIEEDVTCLSKNSIRRTLKSILEDKRYKFIFHNAKFDCHILYNTLGINVDPFFDTMIATAILDENQSNEIKHLALHYLNIEFDKFVTMTEKTAFKIPIKHHSDPTGKLVSYCAIRNTELICKLAKYFVGVFKRDYLHKLSSLFYDVEMPFLKIVIEAERYGVKLDVEYLKGKVARSLTNEIEKLRQRIWFHTGKINLNSTVQVSDALYNKLKLPRVNVKKPNSIDIKTLKKIRAKHKVIQLLIDYREKVNLKTAYADNLLKSAIDERVYTSYGTVGTKTGRMSSKEPNLQQIPSKVGGVIRNAFVADEGRLLASIDFSGQELRVLAHVSNDPTLLAIFKNDGDVHSLTAVGILNRRNSNRDLDYNYFQYCRKIARHFQDEDGEFIQERFYDIKFIGNLYNDGIINTTDLVDVREDVINGVEFEKIRKLAKVVNFGIIYGMGEEGLAETLEISLYESKEYIKGYFDTYPKVKIWIERMKKQMIEVEFTETIIGRKRRVYQEVKSQKKWLVERGFRMGINSIIQGTSSDMIKLASIKLQPLLKELDCRILLWVHDEIIFDVPEGIGNANLKRISDVMCNALPLSCGLKSDIEVGRKWGKKMDENEIDLLKKKI